MSAETRFTSRWNVRGSGENSAGAAMRHDGEVDFATCVRNFQLTDDVYT